MAIATDYELELLQTTLNRILHDSIIDHYNNLLMAADNKQAMDVIITALSANLGIILAQVPESYRENYLEVSKKIMHESLTVGIENIDRKQWGTVGHA